MTPIEAISTAFILFETAYPNSWKGGQIDVWSMLLEGVEPDEILAAAKAWCTALPPREFPPSPAELKSLVSRFCTCGRCWRCNRRAIEAHGRALERGAAGFDADRAVPVSTPPAVKRLAP